MNVFVRALFNMGSEGDANREVVERVGEVMGSGGKVWEVVGRVWEVVGSGGNRLEAPSTFSIDTEFAMLLVLLQIKGRYTCRTLQIHTCVRACAHAVMFGHVLVPM